MQATCLKENSMELMSWVRTVSFSMVALGGFLAAGCGKTAPTGPEGGQPATPAAATDDHSGWWCSEHRVPEEIFASATRSSRPSTSRRATGARSTPGLNRSASSAIRSSKPSSRRSTRRSTARRRRSRKGRSAGNYGVSLGHRSGRVGLPAAVVFLATSLGAQVLGPAIPPPYLRQPQPGMSAQSFNSSLSRSRSMQPQYRRMSSRRPCQWRGPS